jgi:hypothetical protein
LIVREILVLSFIVSEKNRKKDGQWSVFKTIGKFRFMQVNSAGHASFTTIKIFPNI